MLFVASAWHMLKTQNERVLTEIEKYYSNYVVVEDLHSVEDDIIKLAICHLGGSEEYLYPDVSLLCGDTSGSCELKNLVGHNER